VGAHFSAPSRVDNSFYASSRLVRPRRRAILKDVGAFGTGYRRARGSLLLQGRRSRARRLRLRCLLRHRAVVDRPAGRLWPVARSCHLRPSGMTAWIVRRLRSANHPTSRLSSLVGGTRTTRAPTVRPRRVSLSHRCALRHLTGPAAAKTLRPTRLSPRFFRATYRDLVAPASRHRQEYLFYYDAPSPRFGICGQGARTRPQAAPSAMPASGLLRHESTPTSTACGQIESTR